MTVRFPTFEIGTSRTAATAARKEYCRTLLSTTWPAERQEMERETVEEIQYRSDGTGVGTTVGCAEGWKVGRSVGYSIVV